jgi:hypothetical protein
MSSKFAFINNDLSIRVCSTPDGRDGGWSTLPFQTHWMARKWIRSQGYTLVERMPTWDELCNA